MKKRLAMKMFAVLFVAAGAAIGDQPVGGNVAADVASSAAVVSGTAGNATALNAADVLTTADATGAKVVSAADVAKTVDAGDATNAGGAAGAASMTGAVGAVSASGAAHDPAACAVKLERDRKAILAMAGDYHVQFNFEETVPLEAGYKLASPYHEQASETVIVVVDEPGRIVLQHILAAEGMIVKHWRQEWRFENRALLEYQGNNRWRPRTLSEGEAHGTWTQNVYSTDDSPRYTGYGKWVHNANMSYWESNLTARPLPRREYTTRDDYQILMARNCHEITPTGWVHHEDNYKLVIGDSGAEKVLARETGLNIYSRGDSEELADAHKWWTNHRQFWADATAAWDALYASGKPITIRKEVEGQSLHRAMLKLDRSMGTGDKPYDQAEARAQIGRVFADYLIVGSGS